GAHGIIAKRLDNGWIEADREFLHFRAAPLDRLARHHRRACLTAPLLFEFEGWYCLFWPGAGWRKRELARERLLDRVGGTGSCKDADHQRYETEDDEFFKPRERHLLLPVPTLPPRKQVDCGACLAERSLNYGVFQRAAAFW